MNKLIDPGKCSHPSDRQHYNGVQYGLHGEPLMHLYTCMVCGTTLSARIAWLK